VPPIAVFDTNILVSGTGWQGNPYRCLECARAGLVEGVTCKEILDELVEKLQVKLHFSDSQATDTIADLLTFLRLVTITNTLKAIPAVLTMTKSWSVRLSAMQLTLSRQIGVICYRYEIIRGLPLSVLPSSSRSCQRLVD